MNKGALYAILLGLALPLAAYFFVNSKSKNAAPMPSHYLWDTIVTNVKKGKKTEDTVWHRVPNFTFTNQEGATISLDSLHGKIILADFFFTRCPTICPPMTKNMKRLQESIHNGRRVGDKTNRLVHFLSFSIDPERDSVPQLKKWADRFQINPEKWWLLTGSKKAIYDLALNDMAIGLQDGNGVDTNFIHSDRFVLIDSNRYIRGYYKGLDSASLGKLSADLILLTMEKNKDKKSFFAGKLQIIAVAFLCAILGVGLLLFFLRKNKK